jgi:hypothetical protein
LHDLWWYCDARDKHFVLRIALNEEVSKSDFPPRGARKTHDILALFTWLEHWDQVAFWNVLAEGLRCSDLSATKAPVPIWNNLSKHTYYTLTNWEFCSSWKMEIQCLEWSPFSGVSLGVFQYKYIVQFCTKKKW